MSDFERFRAPFYAKRNETIAEKIYQGTFATPKSFLIHGAKGDDAE